MSWDQILKTLSVLGIGAISGSFVTHLLTLSRAKSERKIQSYRKLMGLRILIRQLIYCFIEAQIFFEYHQAKWHISGSPKDSIDLDEARRWMQKSEGYGDRIAEKIQDLFEVLGEIAVLFRGNRKIKDKIDNLYKYKTPVVGSPDKKLNPEGLESWKKTGMREAQKRSEELYAIPIEDLIRAVEEGFGNDLVHQLLKKIREWFSICVRRLRGV